MFLRLKHLAPLHKKLGQMFHGECLIYLILQWALLLCSCCFKIVNFKCFFKDFIGNYDDIFHFLARFMTLRGNRMQCTLQSIAQWWAIYFSCLLSAFVVHNWQVTTCTDFNYSVGGGAIGGCQRWIHYIWKCLQINEYILKEHKQILYAL